MGQRQQLYFKIYGPNLEYGYDKVNFEVLVKKFTLLEKALKDTSRLINGKEEFNYIVEELNIGSAELVLEEVPIDQTLFEIKSGVTTFLEYASNINEGREKVFNFSDINLVKTFKDLCKGTGQSFSYAEFGDNSRIPTITINKPFLEKASLVYLGLNNKYPNYKGEAYESFYGTLKEVDLRKEIPRAKLILKGVNVEIACFCKAISITKLRDSLNKPVSVLARSTYNGVDRLPTRLDLTEITIIKNAKPLSSWRGKFEIPYPDDEDIW